MKLVGHWLRRNCLLKDALEGMINGKKVRGRRHLLYLFIPGKTAALVPEFAVEDLPFAELQPGFLCLQ